MSSVKISGAWKDLLPGCAIKVSGAWKEIDSAHVKVGGAWKKAFQNLAVQLAGTQSAHSHSGVGALITAGVFLKNNGEEYAYGNGEVEEGTLLQNWLLGGAASDFWVRATLNSGNLEAGSDLTGSWLAMSTSRGWYRSDTTDDGSAGTASLTIEIASDSLGTNVLASATYSLSANKL